MSILHNERFSVEKYIPRYQVSLTSRRDSPLGKVVYYLFKQRRDCLMMQVNYRGTPEVMENHELVIVSEEPESLANWLTDVYDDLSQVLINSKELEEGLKVLNEIRIGFSLWLVELKNTSKDLACTA